MEMDGKRFSAYHSSPWPPSSFQSSSLPRQPSGVRKRTGTGSFSGVTPSLPQVDLVGPRDQSTPLQRPTAPSLLPGGGSPLQPTNMSVMDAWVERLCFSMHQARKMRLELGDNCLSTRVADINLPSSSAFFFPLHLPVWLILTSP
ncbi:hypothetical protein CJ030_MR2G027158 [Morella rubra]|uniref:Uncharacterized protein n=1 Tax=Morella rubra TaxID=262757 RepID=A0A6A1W8D9_9ROSI|nr:hypothetical protein CJ030_MR2G027158 [Morella rubra]